MKKKLSAREEFRAFGLDEIEKLCLLIVVSNPKLEQDLKIRISELGGRVLLSRSVKGVAHRPILEVLGLIRSDDIAMFAFAREQDSAEIVETIGREFEFRLPGNGRIFACPVDGYLGAKGPLVED